MTLEGIAGSPGLAIGRAIVVDTRRPGIVRRRIAKHSADEEMERFDRAVSAATDSLREVAERTSGRVGKAEGSILEAYLLMVRDESLREDIERRVRIDRQCAEWALEGAIGEMSQQLRDVHDAYLAERSHDVEFIGTRLQLALTRSPTHDVDSRYAGSLHHRGP